MLGRFVFRLDWIRLVGPIFAKNPKKTPPHFDKNTIILHSGDTTLSDDLQVLFQDRAINLRRFVDAVAAKDLAVKVDEEVPAPLLTHDGARIPTFTPAFLYAALS